MKKQWWVISTLMVLNSLALSPIVQAKQPLQLRCGWLSNPSPSNIWLTDRDGEWLIASQGGYQTPGDWPWPQFKKKEWIVTNAGEHGYGCACFQMRVNPKTHRVLEIKKAYSKSLAACRQESKLKEPK